MADRAVPPRNVVVMGVAGTGKSTVGELLAGLLGVPFAEADDFHPAANVAAMRTGRPLADADRWPWLHAVADWMRAHAATGGVIACSALKYAYRDVLRAAAPDVWFAHLVGSPALITDRVAGRAGHFMPAALVDSQFADLEPLRPDERGSAVSVGQAPERIAEHVRAALTRSEKGVLA